MRTTITLDDDIRRKLREEMRRSWKSFKEIVKQPLTELEACDIDDRDFTRFPNLRIDYPLISSTAEK